MKLRKELLLLLLVMSVASESEELKKQSETAEDEPEEDVSLGGKGLEHLRELQDVRDTMLKIMESNRRYLREEIKKMKEADEEEWKKTSIAQAKSINLPNSNLRLEEEETEVRNEEELLEPLSEETQEPLTPEQQEAEQIFRKAQRLLNTTRSNKSEAYGLLRTAAILGHREARSMLTWDSLIRMQNGPTSFWISNEVISAAYHIFKNLAETGLPSAHMAINEYINEQRMDSQRNFIIFLEEHKQVAGRNAAIEYPGTRLATQGLKGLGFLHATGLGGVNASQAKALLHYTAAALGGDTRAQMALGYRYWAGVTTPASCESALNFYRKVANKVSEKVSFSGGPVIQRVRLLDEQENPGYNSGIYDQDLIEYYQLLAKKGDIEAQVALGQLHYQGARGVPLDHVRAMHYFQHAADAEHPVAMAYLGKIYLEGSDKVEQDNKTAYKYFKKAADLGNPVGQSGLGLMYLYGRGVERDTTKALQYFKQAAEQGWVDGQLQLGNMYFSGTGVKPDYKLATMYFSLASRSGHVLAIYNLAQMHATGTGMARNCPAAVELLKKVAERGKWSDQLMVAHTDYREGRINEAFFNYALLAEMGYEVAQSNAAFILDKGETTILSEEEGLVRALSLWARAAAQGYSAAQVKLGDAYYYGRGTKVDYEAAASHYRLASEPDPNAQAMFNLGYMHERGLGLARDRHLAKRCYDLAAEASPDAKIPVALALIKLSFLFGLDYLQEFSLVDHLNKWDQLLGQNWDLYLIGLLTGMLSLIIYFRRPQPPPPPRIN